MPSITPTKQLIMAQKLRPKPHHIHNQSHKHHLIYKQLFITLIKQILHKHQKSNPITLPNLHKHHFHKYHNKRHIHNQRNQHTLARKILSLVLISKNYNLQNCNLHQHLQRLLAPIHMTISQNLVH